MPAEPVKPNFYSQFLLPWARGSHFPANARKRYETNAKREVPGSPNPFGNPSGVWLWLLNFLEGTFWRGGGSWVSHLMVPELEQRSVSAFCRRVFPFPLDFHVFLLFRFVFFSYVIKVGSVSL